MSKFNEALFGVLRHAGLWLYAGLLSACQPSNAGAGAVVQASATAPQSVSLGIVGFNYTGRYIDQFYVNGAGGSNVDPTTIERGDGGSVMCCVAWTSGTQLPRKIHVRWRRMHVNSPPNRIPMAKPLMLRTTFFEKPMLS